MFQGFSQETVDFMWGIRFNNERGWFQEHKEDYLRHFYQPMNALAQETLGRLLDKFPKSGLEGKVSRIYRDARRLFGRGPYKDHLWFCLFRGEGAVGEQPVLWFQLEPEGWSYGMGYWSARADAMARHRAKIEENAAPMLKLARRLARQKEFVLEGPEYSRAKLCPTPALQEWYNKRSLSVGHEEPLSELLYSPALVDRLAEGFAFLLPYYDYFDGLQSRGD